MDCKICNSYIAHVTDPKYRICGSCQRLIHLWEVHRLDLTFCADCLYAVRDNFDDILHCHRKAPTMLANVYDKNIWPVMKPEEWCGEGKKCR